MFHVGSSLVAFRLRPGTLDYFSGCDGVMQRLCYSFCASAWIVDRLDATKVGFKSESMDQWVLMIVIEWVKLLASSVREEFVVLYAYQRVKLRRSRSFTTWRDNMGMKSLIWGHLGRREGLCGDSGKPWKVVFFFFFRSALFSYNIVAAVYAHISFLYFVFY